MRPLEGVMASVVHPLYVTPLQTNGNLHWLTNLDESTDPVDRESAYESEEQEGRTTGVLLPELGPLEGPLFGLLLGLTLGLLGPFEGPLFGPLFEGLVGTFPLLLVFPGVFGLAGGVVVAGGRPGTPRPLREESNIGFWAMARLATRGQTRGRTATWAFLEYKQTTEGVLEQNVKPHPTWVFWSLTN